MRFGVTLFLTDRTINPVEFAIAVEERGFSSVWFPEHTHIPVSRDTPPPTGDDELADEYRRTLDPYVTLAACAAVTRRIRLGTGVALVAQHHPVVLAKQVATLSAMLDKAQARLDGGKKDAAVAAELRTHVGHLAGAAPGTRKAMLAKVMEAIAARLS